MGFREIDERHCANDNKSKAPREIEGDACCYDRCDHTLQSFTKGGRDRELQVADLSGSGSALIERMTMLLYSRLDGRKKRRDAALAHVIPCHVFPDEHVEDPSPCTPRLELTE